MIETFELRIRNIEKNRNGDKEVQEEEEEITIHMDHVEEEGLETIISMIIKKVISLTLGNIY